jgi:hypothetical protein
MRTFWKADVLLLAVPLLGMAPAPVAPAATALRGEVTATSVTECDYGVCDGTISLLRGGRIQVARVTPETAITTGGNPVLLVEVRPGEEVTVRDSAAVAGIGNGAHVLAPLSETANAETATSGARVLAKANRFKQVEGAEAEDQFSVLAP